MLTDDERSYDWTDVATVVLLALLLVALVFGAGGDACSLKVSIGDSTTTTTTAP